MSSPPVVIDLGFDREPPRLVDAPPRPRWGGLLAAALAALVLATGSAPVAARLSEVRISAGLGDELALSADRLYVIQPNLAWSTADRRTVSAYRLPAGRRLWRQPLPVPGRVRQVFPAPGALLVAIQREGDVETVAVDAATGRMRWRLPFQPVGLTPSGRLALGFADTNRSDPRVERVVAVEPVTGRYAWAYEVPAMAWHDMSFAVDGDRPPRSVVAEPSGRVTVRDLDSGRVLTAVEVAAVASGGLWFQIAGDLLLTGFTNNGEEEVTAYGLPALDRRWTTVLNVGGGYVSADCGGNLCLFSRFGGVSVVDPDTGRPLWSDSRWQTVQTVGGRLLAYSWPAPQRRSTTAVLDPATGDELLDLGRWMAVRPAHPGGHTSAVRVEPGSGRAWFAVVDVAALAVRVLGTVDGISGDCRAADRVLVCRRLDASIGVWRFS